jgi:DNA-binding transcriptional ArsR family regulator
VRQLEAALKAAADPTRTRVLKLLDGRELCVCQIQAVLGLAPSTVSKHLSVLKAAGLVDDRREGRWIHYSLSGGEHNPYASELLGMIRRALERDPRIVADARRLKEVLRMPLSDLCALIPQELLTIGSASNPARRPLDAPDVPAARKGRRRG